MAHASLWSAAFAVALAVGALAPGDIVRLRVGLQFDTSRFSAKGSSAPDSHIANAVVASPGLSAAGPSAASPVTPAAPDLATATSQRLDLVAEAAASAPPPPDGNTSEPDAPAKPPRAAQIEPMVEPVKRVMPKTPDLKETTAAAETQSAASKGSSRKDTKRKVNLVSDVPNCEAGFKLDASGRKCNRIAQSAVSPKKRKR